MNTQNVKNKNDNEVQSMFYSTLGADSVVREALKKWHWSMGGEKNKWK